MSEDESSRAWVRRRHEAVAAAARRLERAQEVETAAALELVAGFVSDARRTALATEELRAVGASGRTYRTGVRGWVLRRDGRAGVGEDGAFYLLRGPTGVPAQLRARWRGVTLVASDPPLIMGKGGRDGDSIALADLLARRLNGPPGSVGAATP